MNIPLRGFRPLSQESSESLLRSSKRYIGGSNAELVRSIVLAWIAEKPGCLTRLKYVNNTRRVSAVVRLKVVSLFSGAGGLDLGFRDSGFQLVFANNVLQAPLLTYS